MSAAIDTSMQNNAVRKEVKSFDPAAVAKIDPKNTFKAMHVVAEWFLHIGEWTNVLSSSLKNVTVIWISTFKLAASPFYIIDLGLSVKKVWDKSTEFGKELAMGLCDTISNAYKTTKFFLDASIISVPASILGRFCLIGSACMVIGSSLRINTERNNIIKLREDMAKNDTEKCSDEESILKVKERYAMYKIVKSVGLLGLGILLTYGFFYSFLTIPLLIASTLNVVGSLAQATLKHTHPWVEEAKK